MAPPQGSGKDEVALHWTCVAAHQRVATYWHMLPEATQARRAIWEAINPHTGIRRIDEAFPHELRATTREQEMMIKFKNGSTWQVVGSDNFNSLVGSPPAGIVFSEWSIANPSAWGYMRPILAENGGWTLFIYTPRGKNHGYQTFKLAEKEEGWFCQALPASQTKALPAGMLESELSEYKREYGDEQGEAFFNQEYECSFDAALLGAVYGGHMSRLEKAGRIGAHVEYDPEMPVHTAWDLGFGDSTVIVMFQVAKNEIRVIDFYEASGHDIKHYCDHLKSKAYNFGEHYVPHDAANKLLAAGGRSIVQLAWMNGVKMRVVAATSMANSISALRETLDITYFSPRCEKLVEALKQYRYEYDQAKQTFRDKPVHDWTSHFADACEIMARAWKEPKDVSAAPKRLPFLSEMKAKDIFALDSVEHEGYTRI